MALDWRKRQTDVAQNLLQQGSEALRQNDIELASAALTEAAIVLDMVPEETSASMRLRAQAFNELGVAHQRRQDLETARGFHTQAATICAKIVESGENEFRGNAAATHLNLSNICAALGDNDAAFEALDVSRDLVDTLLDEGEETIRQMALAVYMTTASLQAARGDFEKSNESQERAISIGSDAVEAGRKELLVQIAQGCQQLSVLMYQGERYDDALRWGREAESYSERAFEEIGQDVVPIYIVSQINLISYNQEQGHFADAEDSLWKAIEIVGNDPRLLRRGQEFYEHCRKQADARLEKGGLPREEIEQGFADLSERIEEIGGLPEEEEQEAMA